MKYSDFNLIPIFVAIMEEQSFSGAAKRLGLSQSAVSQSATKLKALFNDPLFLRESHGITPTKFAHSIYPALSSAIEGIKLTTPEYHNFDPKSCERQFTISALSVFGLNVLPIASRLIRQTAPNVCIKGESIIDEESASYLLRNHYDLALGVDYGQHQQLCSELIFQAEFCIVSSKDHPRLTGTHISTREFLQEKHVAHTVPNQKQAYLLHKGLSCENILRQRDIAWYSNNISEMLSILEQNDYLGVFPKKLFNQYIENSNLKIMECDFLPDKINIAMFWHASRNNDPSHKWLRGIFSESAKALGTL